MAQKKVLTHSFNGVSFKIGVDEPYIGWCDRPEEPQQSEYPAIRLPEGLPKGNRRNAKRQLIVLLHECLHASDWNKHEDTVDRMSTEIGGLLWRLGYRRI